MSVYGPHPDGAAGSSGGGPRAWRVVCFGATAVGGSGGNGEAEVVIDVD